MRQQASANVVVGGRQRGRDERAGAARATAAAGGPRGWPRCAAICPSRSSGAPGSPRRRATMIDTPVASQALQQVEHEPQRRAVGPVRVVDRDQHRAGLGEVRQQPEEAVDDRVGAVVALVAAPARRALEQRAGERGRAGQQAVVRLVVGAREQRLEQLQRDAEGEVALELRAAARAGPSPRSRARARPRRRAARSCRCRRDPRRAAGARRRRARRRAARPPPAAPRRVRGGCPARVLAMATDARSGQKTGEPP